MAHRSPGSIVVFALAAFAGCGGTVLDVGSNAPDAEQAPGARPPPPAGAAISARPSTIAPCAGPSGTVSLLLEPDAAAEVGGFHGVPNIAVDATHVYFTWRESEEQELLLRAPKSGGPVEEVRRGFVAALGASPASTFWVRRDLGPNHPATLEWRDGEDFVNLGRGVPMSPIIVRSHREALLSMEDDGIAGGKGIYRFMDEPPQPTVEKLVDTNGAMAFDGARLFFLTSDYEGELRSRSLTDAKETVVSDERLFGPVGVDADAVYAIRRTNDGFVLRAFAKDGSGTSTEVFRAAASCSAIRADADALYLADPGIDLADTNPSNPPPPIPGGVFRLSRGGAPVRVHEELRGVHVLASDDSAVYWVATTGLRCYRK